MPRRAPSVRAVWPLICDRVSPASTGAPWTRTPGGNAVAKPPGTTRSRSLPVARYCGPARTSSATACKLRRVTPSPSPFMAPLSTARPRRSHRGPSLAATGLTITLTDILADVLERRKAMGNRDDGPGQDVLRRVGEASVLILISLADGPKHGYALIQDIKELAGVELGPGTLYGALDRLERLALIESLPAEDRRHPYPITAPGAAGLRLHLDSLERVSAAGRLRLQLGGI